MNNVNRKNVIDINANKRPKFVTTTFEIGNEFDGHKECIFRIPDSVSEYDEYDTLAFSEIPVASHFIYDQAKSRSVGTPGGVYIKISETSAILLLDSVQANIPEQDDVDYIYGDAGKTYRIKKTLNVKVLNCDINLRG